MHPVELGSSYRHLSHIGRQLQEPAVALLNWPQVAYMLMAVSLWLGADMGWVGGLGLTAVGLIGLSVRQNEFVLAWGWAITLTHLRLQTKQVVRVEIASGWQSKRSVQGAVVYRVARAEVVGKV